MSRDTFLRNVNSLIQMHSQGQLGGDVMPEDALNWNCPKRGITKYIDSWNVPKLSKELIFTMGVDCTSISR